MKAFFKFLYLSIPANCFQGSLRRACSSFQLCNGHLSCCLFLLDHFYKFIDILELSHQSLREMIIATPEISGWKTQLHSLFDGKFIIIWDSRLTWRLLTFCFTSSKTLTYVARDLLGRRAYTSGNCLPFLKAWIVIQDILMTFIDKLLWHPF